MNFVKERNLILDRETAFLKNFAGLFKSNDVVEPEEEDNEETVPKTKNVIDDETLTEKDRKLILKFQTKQTSRAKSLVELKERLQASKKNVKVVTSMEKKVKNAMKKKKRKEKLGKLKQIQKNRPEKGVPSVKEELKQENVVSQETPEPSNGLVYSKIDFPNEEVKKVKKDPKKTLERLKKQKEFLTKLRETGDVEKAVKIKSKAAFESALAKASGEKVMDDPILLQKSIKKKEQKVKQSKKKWTERLDKVKKEKDERQKKRQENIDKRKKTKKSNKIKKAVKRGRITL